MKPFSLILFFLLAASVYAAPRPDSVADINVTQSGKPEISFISDTHDFGSFHPDSLRKAVFRFRNDGDAPLVILRASSDCGCTVPVFPRDSILPGSYGELKVSFNGHGQKPGTFMKVIKIRTNASNSLVRLYIKGEIK